MCLYKDIQKVVFYLQEKSNLLIHGNSHRRQDKFFCRGCSAGFKFKSGLIEHARSCSAGAVHGNSPNMPGTSRNVQENAMTSQGNSQNIQGNSMNPQGNTQHIQGNSMTPKGYSQTVQGTSVTSQVNYQNVQGNMVTQQESFSKGEGNSVDVFGNYSQNPGNPLSLRETPTNIIANVNSIQGPMQSPPGVTDNIPIPSQPMSGHSGTLNIETQVSVFSHLEPHTFSTNPNPDYAHIQSNARGHMEPQTNMYPTPRQPMNNNNPIKDTGTRHKGTDKMPGPLPRIDPSYQVPKDGPFICDICLKQFDNRVSLRKHRNNHLRPRNIQCPLCPKRFKHQKDLDTHSRSHSTERPFSCDLCDLAFKSKSNLQSHIATHSDRKAFSCDICQRSFTQMGNLRIHQKQVHLIGVAESVERQPRITKRDRAETAGD